MEHIAVIVLCGIVVYQAVLGVIERRQQAAREGQILNRLMARDFSDYARYTKELEQEPAPIVQPEEEIGVYPVD